MSQCQTGCYVLCPGLVSAEMGLPGEGPEAGPEGPRFSSPHLKHPVALKKTSGSTTSRDILLLPSHQPEKGMMTRSARTGRASVTSSSFSSSVEDRFQSSPGDKRCLTYHVQFQKNPVALVPPKPGLQQWALPGMLVLSNLLSVSLMRPFSMYSIDCLQVP